MSDFVQPGVGTSTALSVPRVRHRRLEAAVLIAVTLTAGALTFLFVSALVYLFLL